MKVSFSKVWGYVKAAAGVLGFLNSTGVVKVKETDKIVGAVESVDKVISGQDVRE